MEDPNIIVGIGLTVLDEIISMIAHIKAQGSMTNEQILAQADAQDLANLDAIKALLAQ